MTTEALAAQETSPVRAAMLTTGQRAFFSRNGYLQLPGMVADGACDYLIDRAWERLPQDWSRRDPSTWTGEVADACHTASLRMRRGHIKLKSEEFSSDRVFLSALGPGSRLEAVAEELIGHRLAKVLVRGLYVIAPFPELADAKTAVRPHVEAHPIQIVTVTYLDDVGQGEGGLSVWPGSHHALYGAFDSRLEFVARPDYAYVLARYDDLQPVELTGRKGDVILLHHRLLHAPSLNWSACKLRIAVFADYRRSDYPDLCRLAPEAGVWEDWPAQLATGQDGSLDAADFVIEARAPRGGGERTGSSARSKSESTVNNNDASALARSRRAGDTWLAISTNPATLKGAALYPRGKTLKQSLVVDLNGQALQSVSHNDFIARLELAPDANELRIGGVAEDLWMKVVRFTLPFAASKSLIRRRLEGAGGEVRIDLSGLAG